MESSVDTTIEKIKIKEQMKEAKLKEKREFDVTVASLNRLIRDTKTKRDKLEQEIVHMQKVTDNLQSQINVENCQRDALFNQVDKLLKELNQLRTESERKLATVWDLRTALIDATRHITDACDIRKLLIKSTVTDLTHTLNSRRQQHTENMTLYKQKLQTALEKREYANIKRIKLLEKPENDDEFIRIKEALRYSEQMIKNLQNQLK